MTETDAEPSETPDSGDEPPTLSVFDLARYWYHIPVLAMVMGFMFGIRTQTAHRFTRTDTVTFAGNDAWYHLREVTYTVKNWPMTMPMDVWTRFPIGSSPGQFGTLYDQIVATAALIIGLGSPSEQTIALTLLYAPAVFGTLLVIPVYLVTKRLSNRVGGIFAVSVLALLPGLILQRGLVGYADHNIAEPFFMTIAVLALLKATEVAYHYAPIVEQITSRDIHRQPVTWAILAGVATTLYMWVWPPGILIVGIYAIFLGARASIDQYNNRSPDHIGLMGAGISFTSAALLLPTIDTLSPTVTTLSSLHVIFAFMTGCGSLFLVGLGRYLEKKPRLDNTFYPVLLGGSGIMLAGLGTVIAPDITQVVYRSAIRAIGLTAGAGTRTIAEAQSLLSQTNPQYGISLTDVLLREYGLAVFTAIVTAVVAVGRSNWFTDRTEKSAEFQFIGIWTFVLLLAAFTQIRFNYYFAVPVVIWNGVLLTKIIDLTGATRVKSVKELSAHQILSVTAVVILVLSGLLVPITIGGTENQPIQTNNAVEVGKSSAPGSFTQWSGALDYLQTETPEEGTYGGAENKLEYYGTYDRTDDYAYPEGTYGVLSWWDYGHWITVHGERIPNANPFQEGTRVAADYLLAPNPETAEKRVEQVKQNDNAETRYVMVDWKMVNPRQKFGAPVVFNKSTTSSDYMRHIYRPQNQSLQYAFTMKTQRYYESMMVRLYHYHGSAASPQPFVVDWEPIQEGSDRFGGYPQDGTVIKRFNTTEEARNYTQNDPTSQIGGVGAHPSERVPALEHYRLVHASESSAVSDQTYLNQLQRTALTTRIGGMHRTNPSWVKTFERVPGATITGTADPNSTVRASVRMRISHQSNFTYTQFAETGSDGQFTLTVPYSTRGYSDYGPENGYTNTSVRAETPYMIQSDAESVTTVHVNESAIVTNDSDPVTVSLADDKED